MRWPQRLAVTVAAEGAARCRWEPLLNIRKTGFELNLRNEPGHYFTILKPLCPSKGPIIELTGGGARKAVVYGAAQTVIGNWCNGDALKLAVV